ncbi:hypothetical protein BJV78DRAFT_1166356 [Lactifluus subvellereus]|nr:hypothetical protein BJV78DRAFT_1166356 [Lactifluus subvellereus]
MSVDRQHSTISSKRRRTPPRGSAYSRDRSPARYSRSPRRADSPPRRRGSSSHLSPSRTTRDIRPLPRHSSSQERPAPSKHPDSDRQPDHVPKSYPGPMALQTGSRDRPVEQEAKSISLSSAKSTAVATSSGTTTSTTLGASSEAASMPSGSAKVPSRPFPEILPPPPSLNPAPPKDEMTPERRRDVWLNRIDLMADATQEYMDLGKLEQDVQSRRRQVQSPAFDTLPSDIKAAFQTALANTEVKYDKQKASLNSTINRLSETDFWPSVPSQKVGDIEAKLKEAKTRLGGLADSVGQLYKRIEGLYEQRSDRPGTGPPGAEEDGVVVGSSDGDSRVRKRRRLSVDGGGDDTLPSDVREDVESIRDTIREIEDRLGEVENDMAQHSSNIMEHLEVKLEEKIEEIARSADVANLVDVRLNTRAEQTIQAFNESFAQADREITELAQEMAELIPRLNTLQGDNDLFKQEEAEGKELLAQLVKADQDNAEAIARLQEEARTLQSALAAHAKRTLPPSPALPLSGPFMEAIKGSVVKQVHEQVLSIVAENRTEIERIAKARDMELYEKLRGKLDQSAKMSQLILTWIEHHPEDARQALSAATARAQAGGAGSSS